MFSMHQSIAKQTLEREKKKGHIIWKERFLFTMLVSLEILHSNATSGNENTNHLESIC